MKLETLKEHILWEDDEIALVAIEEGTSTLKVALKGKAGRLIKDIDKLAKKGMQKAGIIGAYALDNLKRYKKLKHNSNRSLAFYARSYQEKRTYARMVKDLTKSGQYKVVRTFPYPGGGRSWELQRKSRITEVLRVSNTNTADVNSFDVESASAVGEFEGNKIWAVNPTESNSPIEMYAIKDDDDNIIAYIIGYLWELPKNNQTYFMLLHAHADPKYRGKGLVTSLYMFLAKKKHTKVMSDQEQTTDGEALWNRIKKQHGENVKVLDTETGKEYSIDEIPSTDLYVDGSDHSKKSQKYRLVLEHLNGGFPTFYNIVKENIVYTDPLKYGIFD